MSIVHQSSGSLWKRFRSMSQQIETSDQSFLRTHTAVGVESLERIASGTA